ncbi:MAG: ABC transporter permease [Rhodospirillaceae bacterium]
MAALLALPVLVVGGYIFAPTGGVWDHLVDTVLTRYVVNSAALLVGVGVGTFVIGVGTAWLVTMCRFPGQKVFEWALLLPFALPAYVIAYTYTGLLDFAGPVQTALREAFGWSRQDYWFPAIRSIEGAIAMMTLVLYPYVYLLARAAFLEQSVCALEVARTLGRGAWRCFFSIALPLARPAIAAGLSLALMEALADFGTVSYFAVDTFTTGIYRAWSGLGQPAAAAQLSAVLLGFVLLVMVAERLSRGRARFHHTTSRYRHLPGYRLRGAAAAAAVAACALPILLGFLVPAGFLLAWSVETADTMIDASFVRIAANSLLLAVVTAVLAVAVALLLGYGARLHRSPAVQAATRVAAMGYAIPGSVIAIGILLVSTRFDHAIDGWARGLVGVATGLILTGTLAGIVYAYLVRFMAVSLNAIDASLAKVTPSMDAAARTLGCRPGAVLRRVHAPLMKGSVLTAAILVFVDVMKELPATIILRPFNLDTLAIRTYQLVSDERLHDASSAALAIVLFGIVPVILLSLAIARSRPGERGG